MQRQRCTSIALVPDPPWASNEIDTSPFGKVEK